MTVQFWTEGAKQMIYKVIWIRCYEINEVDQIEKDILEFIKEDSSLVGDIPVKVFVAKNRIVVDFSHILSHVYDMSEDAVNVLKEKYGDENVKIVEQEFAEHTEEYDQETIEERIASALERIASNLEDIAMNTTMIQSSVKSMEELTECIVRP